MVFELPASLIGALITGAITFVVFVLTQIINLFSKKNDLCIAKLEQLLLACVNLAAASKVIERGNPENLENEANVQLFLYYKHMSDVRALYRLHFPDHADLFNPVLENAHEIMKYYSKVSKGQDVPFPFKHALELSSSVHSLIDVVAEQKERFTISPGYYIKNIME